MTSSPPASEPSPASPNEAGEPTLPRREGLFPIVGIGASAGGLEAFTQLLRALPVDTGAAFVLVQHLAPHHPSALAEILSRATGMPVTEVQDEPVVEPNHVYVIPPGQGMVIVNGALHLLPREAHGAPHPIDKFLRSLAEDRGQDAIGVVLSGTASDGTLGLGAIKAEGGITFAQDESAQQPGMPHSAIASGHVDFVLPPEAIAREIARISRTPRSEIDRPAPECAPSLDEVIRILYRRTRVDFTDYKTNTLFRRITRRMVLQRRDSLKDYVAWLDATPEEVDALYADILINVTSFWRNPEAFEALKSTVFPQLVADRRSKVPVRLWTIGCSTGEEAYSLAMAWTEFAEANACDLPIQIFATDLSEACVATARGGVYSKDIAQDLTPERLQRFFVDGDGHYRVSKDIRERCIFSRHNVLADPPFSRIDLISCRNMLIYLERTLQQKIVPMLHYSLKPGGFLWLGNSETVGTFRNLFNVHDARQKIYSKRQGSPPQAANFALNHSPAPRGGFAPVPTRASGEAHSDLHRVADRMLLARFAPPSVLLSVDLDILQFRGDTSPYLTPSPGKASLNLLRMLREGLASGVRSAILRADKEKSPVRQQGLRVTSHGLVREVAVDVIPLKAGDVSGGGRGGFLLLFDEIGRGAEGPPEVSGVGPVAAESEILRLSQELTDTRDYLQAVIEHQESANEELQSANEEVQSANEELQSINEEMETSKEELQSSNEELATVNDELNDRNSELNRVNNDLVNLLGSIKAPIVMLGPDRCIRRFTPAAEKFFNLVTGDNGRRIGAIKLNFEMPDLEAMIAEVLETGGERQRDVVDQSGRWHSLWLRPYRTVEHRIDGVVLVMLDVDVLKRAGQYTRGIVETIRQPLLVLDANLRVRTANQAFYDTFETLREDTEGSLVYDLGNGQWDVPRLRDLLEEIRKYGKEFIDFEVEHTFSHIGRKIMLLNARRLVEDFYQEGSILVVIEDVTERRRTDQQLRQNAADLTTADRRKNEFLAVLAHELRNPLAPMRNALHILRETHGDAAPLDAATLMMERQVTQMARLVDDLLDVSRISRDKIELRQERVELKMLLNRAVDVAMPACALREHELYLDLPLAPVFVNGDPVRLVQVVGNLLHNANKFTDKGGRVWLSLACEANQAVIRVRDNGIGIAAGTLDRIFDVFMQVDTSLERSASGLGIGLSLVKRLVELHGGTVEANSPGLGLGSEFVVRLPLAEASTETRLVPADAIRAAATPRRILVVDDNIDSAQSLAMLLQLAGHETHTAADGLQALEVAEQVRPDVVMLDLGMPGLNGFDACKRIRAEAWGKGTLLIAISGWGQDEYRQRSLAAGFNHHFVKPVDYDALTVLLAPSLPP